MRAWKDQLKNVFKTDSEQIEIKRRQEAQALLDQKDADRFFSSIVVPAFEEIKTEFIKYNKLVDILRGTDFVQVTVSSAAGFKEYSYKISIEARKPLILTYSVLKDDNPIILSKINVGPATIDEISKDFLAQHFVEQYGSYKKYFREK